MNNPKLHILILLIFVGLFLVPACKTVRKITGDSGKKHKATDKLIKAVKAQQTDYETFSAKMAVKYEMGKQKFSTTAFLRMKRDSIVWISLRAPFGIEIVRIALQNNNFTLVNRLNSEYCISEINNILPYEVEDEMTLSLIQSLFLNEWCVPSGFFTSDKKTMMTADSVHYTIVSTSETGTLKVKIGNRNKKIREMTIETSMPDYQTTATITYQSYKMFDNQQMPEDIIIKQTKNEVETIISFHYKNITFDKKQNYPVKIPEDYRLNCQ